MVPAWVLPGLVLNISSKIVCTGSKLVQPVNRECSALTGFCMLSVTVPRQRGLYMDEHEPYASILVETRDIDGQGRGYVLRGNVNTTAGGCLTRNHTGFNTRVSAGTTVLKGGKPTVAVVHDSHEKRNCRNCLQPTEDTAAETYALSSSNTSDDWLPCFRERAFSCQICQRSVLCTTCYEAAVPSAGTSAAAHDYGTTAGPDPNHRAKALSHDSLECEALANLSNLQREQPNLAGSLLGGNTVFLRLLLQLLALRAQRPGSRALGRGRGTSETAQASVRERYVRGSAVLQNVFKRKRPFCHK